MTDPNHTPPSPPAPPQDHLAERLSSHAIEMVMPHTPEPIAVEPEVTHHVAPEPSAETPGPETAAETVTPAAEPPEAAPPASAEPAPKAKKSGGTPLWLTLLLVLALAAEPLALRVLLPQDVAPAMAPPPQLALPVDGSRIDAVDSRLAELARRIDALEHASPMTALAPAAAAPAAAAPVAVVDRSAERSAEDAARLQALESRLAALETRPAQALPDVEGQISAASATLNARIAEMDASIKRDVAQATQRAAFANRLRAAFFALDAGKPLGTIPDAPPALAQFADKAAPTEPALRLSFARYADTARAASQPGAEIADPVDRAWERVKNLVTVREGDHVIIGSRTASLIEDARGKLDAGDLAGAVTALAGLDAPAKAAMAAWIAQAQSLLDARAALLAMAAKS